MPTIMCNNCGGHTNTACSNHLFPIREDGKANECYCRWNTEEKQWEKGCAWDKMSELERQIYKKMIKS